MKKFNLSKEKKSGDYNPFYTGGNNIFPEPPTEEEMLEYGFKYCEYKYDIDTGYYAFVCYTIDRPVPGCICYNSDICQKG